MTKPTRLSVSGAVITPLIDFQRTRELSLEYEWSLWWRCANVRGESIRTAEANAKQVRVLLLTNFMFLNLSFLKLSLKIARNTSRPRPGPNFRTPPTHKSLSRMGLNSVEIRF